MKFLQRIPLVGRIIIALALGILIGILAKHFNVESVIQVLATFNMLFTVLLGFAIPLLIFAFIAPGIGSIGAGAGKLVALALVFAYTSSVLAGFFAAGVSLELYPKIMDFGAGLLNLSGDGESLVEPFFTFALDPIFSVTTALLLAFVIGLGVTTLPTKNMFSLLEDFREIITKLLNNVVIPLLPLHVLGIFGNLTYSGQAAQILSSFVKVFATVLIMHVCVIVVQYLIAGLIAHKNPWSMLKAMFPAYATALGTQSSAATIPVTLQAARKAGMKPAFADFLVPLNANIHLSGSIVTITSCAIAVAGLSGNLPTFTQMIPVVLVLGIMMVAAPGAPGGAVMAAIGVLQAMMGFDDQMVALMIVLYLTQDSFGTATNVVGDGAVGNITQATAQALGLADDVDESEDNSDQDIQEGQTTSDREEDSRSNDTFTVS